MKPQLTKKLFAFIIAGLVFLIITEPVDAQKKCNQHCPKGYSCVSGYCQPDGYFCQCGARRYGCTTSDCLEYCAAACGAKISNISSSNNPSIVASPTAAINFQLEDAGNVSIRIYDVSGKLIKTLMDTQMQQGNHQIDWNEKDEDGNPVSFGVYILQFDTDNRTEIKKLVLN